jgi:chromatin structure-remodeling complex subunit RSC1/2
MSNQQPSQMAAGHQYTPRHPQHSASPVPAYNPSSYTPAATYPSYGTPSQNPQSLHQHQHDHRQYAQPHYGSTPASNYGYQQPQQHAAHLHHNSSHRQHYNSVYTGRGAAALLDSSRQAEVYILQDKDNFAIPEDIRNQYHTDDQGHIMFFSTPPLDNNKPPIGMTPTLGHSAKYLAWKAGRAEAVAKRKAEMEVEKAEREEARKKAKMEEEAYLKKSANELLPKALELLVKQTTETMLDSL